MSRERFLSCDWGTSNFRLRLIESNQTKTLAEESTGEGMANTFKSWKETGKAEEERVAFYLAIIKNHINSIEKKIGDSLDDIPLIISGMASANIGIMEIPYKNIPFSTNGSDLQIKVIDGNDFFRHTSIIISGVRSEDDVMRGEETKIVGCSYETKDEAFLILPGTHPKHIQIKDRKVVSFQTYMTGEFFKLLSEKSILSNSVEESPFESDDLHQSFLDGVIKSKTSNLLHNSFLVRTNQLFNKYSKKQNYFYLSGLLIGSELGDLSNKTHKQITIVSGQKLKPFYEAALAGLGAHNEILIVNKDADEALLKGQQQVFKKYFS